VSASMTWNKPGLMRSVSPRMTSRTVCTRTRDGNGEPPPRSRKPGAHRAPSWSSCRPPCFHLRGRGSNEARTKHVIRRPSQPVTARRSSSVARAPPRNGVARASIGCRNTSRSPREPLSRFGRLGAATRTDWQFLLPARTGGRTPRTAATPAGRTMHGADESNSPCGTLKMASRATHGPQTQASPRIARPASHPEPQVSCHGHHRFHVFQAGDAARQIRQICVSSRRTLRRGRAFPVLAA
jgi:hypothetical protein